MSKNIDIEKLTELDLKKVEVLKSVLDHEYIPSAAYPLQSNYQVKKADVFILEHDELNSTEKVLISFLMRKGLKKKYFQVHNKILARKVMKSERMVQLSLNKLIEKKFLCVLEYETVKKMRASGELNYSCNHRYFYIPFASYVIDINRGKKDIINEGKHVIGRHLAHLRGEIVKGKNFNCTMDDALKFLEVANPTTFFGRSAALKSLVPHILIYGLITYYKKNGSFRFFKKSDLSFHLERWKGFLTCRSFTIDHHDGIIAIVKECLTRGESEEEIQVKVDNFLIKRKSLSSILGSCKYEVIDERISAITVKSASECSEYMRNRIKREISFLEKNMDERVLKKIEFERQQKDRKVDRKKDRVTAQQKRDKIKELRAKIVNDEESRVSTRIMKDIEKSNKKKKAQYEDRFRELIEKPFSEEEACVLSPKGKFIHRMNEVILAGDNEKWRGDWKFKLCYFWYLRLMSKSKGHQFTNEFARGVNSFSDVAMRQKWVKNLIESAGVDRVLKAIYFCCAEPEKIYGVGLFNGKFGLAKLATYSRLSKVERIIDKERYFADDKLFEQIEMTDEEYYGTQDIYSMVEEIEREEREQEVLNEKSNQ